MPTNNNISPTLPREWAILPETLDVLLHQAARVARQNARTTPEPTGDLDYQLDGSVAIVPVHGALAKNGLFFFGWKLCDGMRDIASCLRRAAADSRVKAIMLDVDSPGGTVDGIEELAEAVSQVGLMKPVYAFADGLMASAAYWLSCSAREIAAPATAQVGSIGVILIHREYSKALEENGIACNIIAAGHYKAAGNAVEPLSEEMRSYLQAGVDETYDLFLKAVEKGRGVDREKSLTMADGKIFSGSEALAKGLIDRVCSRSEFLQHIKEGVPMNSTELKAQYPEAVSDLKAEFEQEHRAALSAAKEEGMKIGCEQERARMVALAAAAIGEEAGATLKELAESDMTPEQFDKVKKVLASSGNKLDALRQAHSGTDVAPRGSAPRSAAGFEQLVDNYMVEHNARRGEAVRAIAEKYPEAHQKWLKELQN